MILPDVQRNLAKQLDATTISLESSHASLVSHPNEIAKLILDAAKECSAGNGNKSDRQTDKMISQNIQI